MESLSSFFLFAPWEYFFLFFIVLYGMTIRSITGFGGISISLPLLLLFHSNPLVFIPIMVLQAVWVFAALLFQERHHIDFLWINTLFPVIVLLYIFGFLGLLEFSDQVFSLLLGVVAIFLAIVFGWQKFFMHEKNPRPLYQLDKWDYILLICAGYFGGLALSGGIFLSSVLLRYTVSKQTFRSLLALSGLLFTIPKLFVFSGSFFYGWYDIPIDIGFIIVSTLATVLAIPLGKKLSEEFSQQFFDALVIIVLILSGFSLLYLGM